MWQRWNQGSHIFEKSTDNGASWTPLGLNGSIITEGTIADARLSANVALKNIDNNFSSPQTIFQTLRLVDPPNTEFSWYNTGNYLRLINSVYGQVAYFDANGNLSIAGSASGGPGLISAAGKVMSAQNFYELGRSYFMGQRQGWTPSLATDTNAAITTEENYCSYYVVGWLVFVTFFLRWSLSTSTAFIQVSAPPGLLPGLSAWEQQITRIYLPATGPETGYFEVIQSIGGFRVRRSNGAAWPAGATYNYILGQMFYGLA